ncbi:MAG: LysM peptidoglycan-binding domain-containing protein [Duncaniella sp.]|nr:LysM peptidoglycan-binding domain-containing protein [Duncaniella sp.]
MYKRQELAQTQNVEKLVRKTHVVTRGENIRDIARQYGVSATDIKRWNKLRSGKIKEGDKLVIEVFERISPDNVKVVAAQEVAQVSFKNDTSVGSETTQAQTASASDVVKADAAASSSATKASIAKKTEAAKPAATTAKKATTTASPTIYKVKSGDTLDKIARKHGTTVAALQAANGMSKNNTRINIGQKLKIPAKTAAKKSTKRRRR